jgi:hypothetical protein
MGKIEEISIALPQDLIAEVKAAVDRCAHGARNLHRIRRS